MTFICVMTLVDTEKKRGRAWASFKINGGSMEWNAEKMQMTGSEEARQHKVMENILERGCSVLCG